MARYLVTGSDRLHDFLQMRIRAQSEDYQIAYQFLNAKVDHSDHDAHNYYDIVLSDNGKPAITYTTSKRLLGPDGLILGDAYERNTRRIAGKPGKVAQRVTGIKDGRALDVFVNALSAYLAPPDESLFDVAIGTDITYWYSDRHYCGCDGQRQGPWSSCMRDASFGRLKRFLVYEESAKMLIRTCETCKKLVGRAILWEDADGDKFIDRIYATTTVAEQMREWALRHGYTSIYGMYGRNIKHFSIEASRQGIENLPYFDSLGACRQCFRLYYGNRPRECQLGSCKPHNKTFQVVAGKMLAPEEELPGTCEDCGRELNAYERCPYEAVCGLCEETYCSATHDRCQNQCQECDCGAMYAFGDECPNTVVCHIHDTSYCQYDGCPDQQMCYGCRWQGCDQSDALHHQYCEKCEEWWCSREYRWCPNAPPCYECGDSVPCEEAGEREHVRQTPYGEELTYFCRDCGPEGDDIQSLMANMIPHSTQLDMAMYDLYA